MKIKICGFIRGVGVAWVALLGSAADVSAVDLTDGHTDLVVRYVAGTWEWRAVDENFDELDLENVRFVLGANTEVAAPANPSFTPILGPAGSPVWLLPQSFEPAKLFLGFDGSGTGAGVFTNNRVNLTLHHVDGPGEFALYSVNGFGTPTAVMNTRDGISAESDRFQLNSATGHVHYAWAFSAPGEYRIAVEASATLAANGNLVASEPTEWRFHVVPEPSSAALCSLAAVLLTARRSRRR